MSEHTATLRWTRTSDDFTYRNYNREHTWEFEGGVSVPASAAPAYLGREDHVDPEEAFVASLASCHMLTFLALACKKRFVVDAYNDVSVGFLEKNEAGKLAVTRVILRPQVTFGGEKQPSPDELAELHHLAHENCFIASSVLTTVTVEG